MPNLFYWHFFLNELTFTASNDMAKFLNSSLHLDKLKLKYEVKLKILQLRCPSSEKTMLGSRNCMFMIPT